MRAPTLLTVILNYRTADMTLKALDAVLRELAGIAGEVVSSTTIRATDRSRS